MKDEVFYKPKDDIEPMSYGVTKSFVCRCGRERRPGREKGRLNADWEMGRTNIINQRMSVRKPATFRQPVSFATVRNISFSSHGRRGERGAPVVAPFPVEFYLSWMPPVGYSCLVNVPFVASRFHVQDKESPYYGVR